MPMTRASLRALMKTEQRHRTPLPKVSLFVYKVQSATAPTKAPPKTFLFGERGLGRRNPTKEASSRTSPYCQEGSILPSVDQGHEGRRPSLGAKLIANVVSLPA